MKLDFGSGHNPKRGYKSCDITSNPYLDFYCDPDSYCIKHNFYTNHLNIEKDVKFEEIHVRNVIHHIKNLKKLFKEFKRKLTKNGILTIIDCNEECYKQNLNLDILWYRYLIPRYNIWICKEYRNIEPILESLGFKLISKKVKDEKTTYKWVLL